MDAIAGVAQKPNGGLSALRRRARQANAPRRRRLLVDIRSHFVLMRKSENSSLDSGWGLFYFFFPASHFMFIFSLPTLHRLFKTIVRCA